MMPLSHPLTSVSVAGHPAHAHGASLNLLADGVSAADLEICNATRRQAQILRALHTRPMHDFDLDSLVVIEGGFATPSIRIRMDGEVWVIDTLEAACFAVILRLCHDLRGAALFADAFALAAQEAEARLERHNAFCAELLAGGDEG